MSLHISIRILVSTDLSCNPDFLKYAKHLLNYFVNKFGEIYGQEYINHNVHNLIHLVKDVQRFGPLDNFSCFCFENYMSQIKKQLKTSNHPLQQFINRYYEFATHCNIECNKSQDVYNLSNLLSVKMVENETIKFYGVLEYQNTYLNNIEPNCFGFLRSGEAVQIISFLKKSDNIFFECKLFNTLKSVYKTPCDSLKLNCGLTSGIGQNKNFHY